MERPLVKICGINDPAVARRAEELGASYLGFIFAERSPRRVDASTASSIARSLSGRARRVGVFVDSPVDAVIETARAVPLDVAQLHSRRYGADDVARLRAAGLEVWLLHSPDSPAPSGDGAPDALLLDGSAGGRTGGTGTLADWTAARRLAADGWRVVLAGGISSANARAAAETGAAVLDVNSSLETAPGVKSIALLEEFFSALAL